MFQLKDKVAVVTGAGSGIGEAIAHTLAGAGARVYVLDRDAAGGIRVAGAITAAGGLATFISVDVSREEPCAVVAKRILNEAGRCDILVNNAGIGHVGTLLTTTGEDFDRLYAVNVKGILHMTKPLLPDMMGRKWGSVINLASVGGVVGIKDRFAYCTTKFAVVGMTKCMAIDHAESKVRFNAICPGRVETPFVQARLKEYPDPKKAYEEMASTQALKRMGRPEEIAAAALYLAADESAFVTGSCLVIDGGMRRKLMQVSLFITCLTDLFAPQVGMAAVKVLEHFGCTVDFPTDQTCCGQPQFNNGYTDQTIPLAKRMIRVFKNSHYVVTPSGSCCAMIREHYVHLLRDDPKWEREAEELAAKTYEFVEFLTKVLKVDVRGLALPQPTTSTYHYTCHLRGVAQRRNPP